MDQAHDPRGVADLGEVHEPHAVGVVPALRGATRRAIRVLPTPPRPGDRRRAGVGDRSSTASISAPRPMKDDACAGRLLRLLPMLRGGGKAGSRSGRASCMRPTGSGTSFSGGPRARASWLRPASGARGWPPPRHQDLPTVGGGRDARRLMDGQPDDAVRHELDGTHMDADPHLDGGSGRPWLGGQGLLALRARRLRRLRRWGR